MKIRMATMAATADNAEAAAKPIVTVDDNPPIDVWTSPNVVLIVATSPEMLVTVALMAVTAISNVPTEESISATIP